MLDELLGVHKSQSRIIVTFERRSVGVRLARALASIVVAVVLSEERRVALCAIELTVLFLLLAEVLLGREENHASEGEVVQTRQPDSLSLVVSIHFYYRCEITERDRLATESKGLGAQLSFDRAIGTLK